MQTTLTKVSLNVEPLAVIHSAAVLLSKINRAKNIMHGTQTDDRALQEAIEYVNVELRKAVGV